jgi:hypothetical protein
MEHLQCWKNRYILMFHLLLSFFTLCEDGFAQSSPKGFVKINDSLLVAQFEVSNGDFNLFLESQHDSVKQAIRFQREQIMLNSSLSPLDVELRTDYHDHQAYFNYPVIFISLEIAKSYTDWLSSKDSNFIYFVPYWEHYLAIYGIEKSKAVLSPFMGGWAKDLGQHDSISIDSCLTLNRDYFPWGSSFF